MYRFLAWRFPDLIKSIFVNYTIKISRINITSARKKSKLYVARRSINYVANHLKFFLTIFKDHVPTSYCVGPVLNQTPRRQERPSEHRLNCRLSAGFYRRLAHQPTRDKIFCWREWPGAGTRDESLRMSAWQQQGRAHWWGVLCFLLR